jgi:hypothetical protein
MLDPYTSINPKPVTHPEQGGVIDQAARPTTSVIPKPVNALYALRPLDTGLLRADDS